MSDDRYCFVNCGLPADQCACYRRVMQQARADRIAALEAEAKDLQAKLTECCLQALAADGEAGEALDRAIKAEAEVARLKGAIDLCAAEIAVSIPFTDDGEIDWERLYEAWRKIACDRADIARAASAQQPPPALNTGDAT